jgi:hypothetical protein
MPSQEPSKKALLAYEADSSAVPPPRQAFCVLQTPPSYDCYEALVNLSNLSNCDEPSVEQVASWKKVRAVLLDQLLHPSSADAVPPGASADDAPQPPTGGRQPSGHPR